MNGMCSTDGFCELLHEVSFACARKEAQALAAGGIAVAEFHALSEIAKTPRPPLEELAVSLEVSRGRLTRIIDALVKKQLVTRRRDTADQRNVILEMTERGGEVLARASSLRGEAGGSLLAMMTEPQRRQLIRSLEMLRDLMARTERSGAEAQGNGLTGAKGRGRGRAAT